MEHFEYESHNLSSFNSTEYVLFNRDGGNATNIKPVIPSITCITNYCLPNVLLLSFVSICGIFANLVVMIVVIKDKRLHTPTFIVISGIAMADFTFLLARYTRLIIDGYFVNLLAVAEYRIIRSVFDFLGLFGASSAIFHLLSLSFIRYYIIVHPLKAHVQLTIKRVLLISIILHIGATAVAAVYLLCVIINTRNKSLQQVTNWVVTVVMAFVPMVVMAVIHVYKAKALLTSLSSTEETVRKMSRVITFVIVCFFITTTPSNVLDIIRLSGTVPYTLTFFRLQMAFRILLFLNSAINPFIYFMFSPQFKRYFKEKWGKLFPSSKKNHADAEETHSTRLTEASHDTWTSKYGIKSTKNKTEIELQH